MLISHIEELIFYSITRQIKCLTDLLIWSLTWVNVSANDTVHLLLLTTFNNLIYVLDIMHPRFISDFLCWRIHKIIRNNCVYPHLFSRLNQLYLLSGSTQNQYFFHFSLLSFLPNLFPTIVFPL